MNIFILDTDPQKCARMHCDKHVVKMILETAQMISTTAHELGLEAPYKPTHRNHPCTKWVRESRHNFNWLLDLLIHLHAEWRYRYNHKSHHKSYLKMLTCTDWEAIANALPDIPMTPFAQAMPDEYRDEDAVKAYRAYYIGEKSELLKYTKREKPEWLLK